MLLIFASDSAFISAVKVYTFLKTLMSESEYFTPAFSKREESIENISATFLIFSLASSLAFFYAG